MKTAGERACGGQAPAFVLLTLQQSLILSMNIETAGKRPLTFNRMNLQQNLAQLEPHFPRLTVGLRRQSVQSIQKYYIILNLVRCLGMNEHFFSAVF